MGDDGTINKVIGNLPANMRDKERVTLAIKECGAKSMWIKIFSLFFILNHLTAHIIFKLVKAGTNACDAAYEIFKCTLGKLVRNDFPFFSFIT